MKVVCIDGGHGGSDSGAIAIDGMPEKAYTLALALAVRAVLDSYDCKVILTRESDVDVDLDERPAIANRAKADLFISLHHDSSSNPLARGGSLYIHTNKRTEDGGLRWLPAIGHHTAPNSYRLAKVFMNPVRQELADRYGIPWRNDVMCADFAVLRGSNVPALLLESHFGSNEHDNWAARRGTFIPDLSIAIAQGIAAALELPLKVVAPLAPVEGTPILGESQATVAQAQAWARSRGATDRFINVAYLYWYYGWLTGIRADSLYSQSAKETGFGRHGGVIGPERNNFAGIKIAAGGGNYDPDAHERFATVEDGVRAHFNHMAGYTGLTPVGVPHGRYHVVKALEWAGSIRTVEELGAKWAPNPDYGASIVRDYLAPMQRMAPIGFVIEGGV